ncbi:Vacuolar protein sorting-associated protein 62 [Tulasnella sp. 419]|nr:Vacuolar protein sorting-associated protein 62 [Tulasnella sp. 419]
MRPYLLTVLSAALCLPVLTAAPLPDNYLALARQYAPQLRFAQKEQWWPSSVDYILQYFIARDDKGNPISSPLPLSTSNLNQLPATSYLSVTDTSSNFAITKGQNPSSTSVPIYTFIAPKENGVVDLFYWVFNPFNLGKKVIALGDVGNHVGDWERMMVRTVNGVAVSADYNAHASGDGVGTMPWAEVKKVAGEDRPVGYVAYGSHGKSSITVFHEIPYTIFH